MLEETLNKTDAESRFIVKPSFFGLRVAARKYVAATAIAVGSLIAYAGCDDDTCETNADCSEDASCLRECTRCTYEDFDSDNHRYCQQEETTHRSRGSESRSGEQCGAYHCYSPHQTTTYTRED